MIVTYLEVVWYIVLAASWTPKEGILVAAGAWLVFICRWGLGVVAGFIKRITLSRWAVLCGSRHLDVFQKNRS